MNRGLQFCTHCGTPLASDAAVFCLACGAVSKGALITFAGPPLAIFGRYRKQCLALTAILALIFVFSLFAGLTQTALGSAVLLVAGGFIALGRLITLAAKAAVFENGIEMDIPKSLNKSVYLPWSRMSDYRWAGNVLRYGMPAGACIVLRSGKWQTSWPYWYFPTALKIPDDALPIIESILSRTLPPPLPATRSASTGQKP
jgi:hypothetical protein